MTTTPTLQGVEYSFGTPDNLEVKVIAQLRALRETWGNKERPYMLSLYIDPKTGTMLVFAGNPAGKVQE